MVFARELDPSRIWKLEERDKGKWSRKVGGSRRLVIEEGTIVGSVEGRGSGGGGLTCGSGPKIENARLSMERIAIHFCTFQNEPILPGLSCFVRETASSIKTLPI